ncbi:MAG: S8 family serine peptidase [Pirellulales bacterium]
MKAFRVAVLTAVLLATGWPARGDERSTGAGGINSSALGLTGTGIAIGMVDQLRPGLPGFDNAEHSHDQVRPKGVFVRDAAATANSDAGKRATQIAGILVGSASSLHGVAPGADLYASAYRTLGTDPGYQHALLATQHVGQQAAGSVRAIGHSWGKGLRTGATLDGQSLLTLGVDWLATQQDVLQVFAGNEGNGGSPLPTDNYNGLDVSFSAPVDGKYTRLHESNYFFEDADGPRRTIDLVAPGANITTPKLGGGTLIETSAGFAPPHVVGAVALLQQHAEARIAAGAARWNADARRHEVMKAVLLNSADKVADAGDGLLLGMAKTIVDTHGKNWLDSDALSDPAVPLDDELGAGQLNVDRAKRQFESGQWNSGETAPRLGWDWGQLTDAGAINKYPLADAIGRGNYVSITLAWDRQVKLDDTDQDGAYDVGESFSELGLTNLDLLLMPRGATSLSQAVASSLSTVDNLEHIFFPVPTTGSYEIWVRQVDAPLGGQSYALAWWTGAGQATVGGLQGDANQDGLVNLNDFGPLKINFGNTGAQLADGDFDLNGRVDLSDFGILKQSFGQRGAVAVPEPATLVLLVMGLVNLAALMRRV